MHQREAFFIDDDPFSRQIIIKNPGYAFVYNAGVRLFYVCVLIISNKNIMKTKRKVGWQKLQDLLLIILIALALLAFGAMVIHINN